MQILVVYDIPDDGKRVNIADVCQDFGLDRLQYSLFSGRLNATHRKDLARKLRDTLAKDLGRVLILPVPDDEWGNRLELLNTNDDWPPRRELARASAPVASDDDRI